MITHAADPGSNPGGGRIFTGTTGEMLTSSPSDVNVRLCYEARDKRKIERLSRTALCQLYIFLIMYIRSVASLMTC